MTELDRERRATECRVKVSQSFPNSCAAAHSNEDGSRASLRARKALKYLFCAPSSLQAWHDFRGYLNG
jgi:hypothetical protein